MSEIITRPVLLYTVPALVSVTDLQLKVSYLLPTRDLRKKALQEKQEVVE